ncbi:MAG: hypothetical protein SVU88_03480 [Candidatus Nanohaloarchaea archaeon]|nr:hypothetical protein [Candidatus Nanohaloarchaea archaeon]
MSKRKGQRREREAKELLEENGYRVSIAKNHRFGANDYFNLFDLLAVGPGPVKLIQVKANSARGITKTGKKASVFCPEDHVDVEYWTCHDREGWRIQRLTRHSPENPAWETLIDERNRDGNMGDYVPEVL